MIVITNNKEEENFIIPNEAIRIRVIANSNSIKDQNEKQIVVSELEKITKSIININNTYEETKQIIKTNINKYEDAVTKVLGKKSFNIDFGEHYFPEKTYKSVVYPSGTYESLLVTIGSGSGDNWWCVLYPPLCMIETNENSIVNYKWYVQELFK